MAGGRKLSTPRAVTLGSHALVFNDDEIRVLLKAAVEREGSQVVFARNHCVNRSHINMVLKGKKSPGPTVARALGLRLRKVYVAD
jgi:hypothetical protein